jgi:hypothetical protein
MIVAVGWEDEEGLVGNERTMGASAGSQPTLDPLFLDGGHVLYRTLSSSFMRVETVNILRMSGEQRSKTSSSPAQMDGADSRVV